MKIRFDIDHDSDGLILVADNARVTVHKEIVDERNLTEVEFAFEPVLKEDMQEIDIKSPQEPLGYFTRRYHTNKQFIYMGKSPFIKGFVVLSQDMGEYIKASLVGWSHSYRPKEVACYE